VALLGGMTLPFALGHLAAVSTLRMALLIVIADAAAIAVLVPRKTG